MDLRHALRQLRGQLSSAEVDIQESGLDASMAGERCDFLNVPICSREVGQAQVPGGVRSELRDIGAVRDSFDYLGPRPF